MSTRKAITIVIAGTIVCASTSVSRAQESFKSAEFLKYSRGEQRAYVMVATGMAGLVAGQNRPEQSQCVGRWVTEHDSSDFKVVIDAMKTNQTYHPLGVILAVLQKACGPFKYRD